MYVSLTSRVRFFGLYAALIVLYGCSENPSVSKITPTRLSACATGSFTGTFVNITQVNLVNASGTLIPVTDYGPAGQPGEIVTWLTATGVRFTVPFVPPGEYRISFVDGGGRLLSPKFTVVKAGEAISATSFTIDDGILPPQVSLTATNVSAPGESATLTPVVNGTATNVYIEPGPLPGNKGPITTAACKTTKYSLYAWNQCTYAVRSATVEVPEPTVTQVSQMTQGNSFTVTGAAFPNPGFCPTPELDLWQSGDASPSVISSGSETTLGSVVSPCVSPGSYGLSVTTLQGRSNLVDVKVLAGQSSCSGTIQVAGQCYASECRNRACVSVASSCPVNPPPSESCLAVASTGCMPDTQSGAHCCNTMTAPAVCIWGQCNSCVAHGLSCGGNYGRTCCTAGEQCLPDPETGLNPTCQLLDPGGQ
jgi:hypothetical protein